MSKFNTTDYYQSVKFDEDTIARLQTLLESREECAFSVCRERRGIWLETDSRESELRLTILSTIKLTVSRVFLINRRIGTMTKVFEILKDFCIENGIHRIVVESVLSSEMSQWCAKNGFVPDPTLSYNSGDFVGGNWNFDL